MSNFLFNPAKVKMVNGSGDFDWVADNVVGVLYDSRVDVTPDMTWATLSSFEVAVSANMSGRLIGSDGALKGESLHFSNVTTQPGLRIKGIVLIFKPSNDLIANFDDGLEGFTGNEDLSLEAADLEIFARTSAASSNTWIAL